MLSFSSTTPSIATDCKGSSPVNLPYLPDELLLNCLARVSRYYYSTLSSVSKRFRSLLASKEIYQTRKLLGRTENCLFFLINPNPCLFILCHRPNRLPNPNPNKSPDNNVMVAFSTRVDFPTDWWGLGLVGSNIYMIGGYHGFAPSSRVSFLDPSYTWHEAPSMHVARKFPKVTVLDGKIYVAGGIEDYNSSNWIECFDPKTQKWEHVPIHDAGIPEIYIYDSLAIEGNLYLFKENSLVYKPKENRWDAVELEIISARDSHLDSFPDSFCIIDNIFLIYRYGFSSLQWCDNGNDYWRDLKGVEEIYVMLPNPYDRNRVRLVNYGGKLVLLWQKAVHAVDSNEKMICCAGIALERRNEQEICGKVEWCDVLLRVPMSCYLGKCIAANA